VQAAAARIDASSSAIRTSSDVSGALRADLAEAQREARALSGALERPWATTSWATVDLGEGRLVVLRLERDGWRIASGPPGGP